MARIKRSSAEIAGIVRLIREHNMESGQGTLDRYDLIDILTSGKWDKSLTLSADLAEVGEKVFPLKKSSTKSKKTEKKSAPEKATEKKVVAKKVAAKKKTTSKSRKKSETKDAKRSK